MGLGVGREILTFANLLDLLVVLHFDGGGLCVPGLAKGVNGDDCENG